MQFVRNFDASAPVSAYGVSALLLADSDETGKKIAAALWGFGADVDWQRSVPAVSCDPALIVVDCDALGGYAAGQAALGRMTVPHHPLAAILISSEVATPDFPQAPTDPVVLCAPVSLVALRVGFEHALRAHPF